MTGRGCFLPDAPALPAVKRPSFSQPGPLEPPWPGFAATKDRRKTGPTVPLSNGEDPVRAQPGLPGLAPASPREQRLRLWAQPHTAPKPGTEAGACRAAEKPRPLRSPAAAFLGSKWTCQVLSTRRGFACALGAPRTWAPRLTHLGTNGPQRKQRTDAGASSRGGRAATVWR